MTVPAGFVPVRVLTLWEPWASLVVWGAKPFEFRSKRPPRTIVGERVIIHAAKRPIDRVEVEHMRFELARRSDESLEMCIKREPGCFVLDKLLSDPDALHYGCGLGSAIVGEARDGIEIARTEFGATRVEVGEIESNWGWPLTDIVRWHEPVPARGSQGIWFWPHYEVPAGEKVT